MNDSKLHFRAVLIDILERLSANERKKLSFLLADDIERSICDDPTIGGTLDIFQRLFDRGRISEENFTYLIEAFQSIRCNQAARSLRELQKKNLSKNHLTYDLETDLSRKALVTAATESSGLSLLNECVNDMEEDKVSSKGFSPMTHGLQINNKKINMPISQVSLITLITNTENNRYRLHSADSGNINKSCRIYFSQKRLIWFGIFVVGFILVISAAIGTIMYFSSLKPDTRTATPPSTVLSSLKTTNARLSADTNDTQCQMPSGHSCTGITPPNTKAEGLGVYYENPCHGPVGCGFLQPYCRLCWIDPNAIGRMDRPQCPPCVSSFLNKHD